MAFMQLETLHGVWYQVETEGGESFGIHESVCGRLPIPDGHADASEDDCPAEDWESICDMVKDYTNGRPVQSVEAKTGWAARYHAPGYMDSTEWGGVYETEDEAAAEANEMYGDDGDSEDEDEDDDDGDEADEPGEDDITTEDHRRFYQGHKLILTVPDGADHCAALRDYMEVEKFYPDVWFISDHGNAHRINISDE